MGIIGIVIKSRTSLGIHSSISSCKINKKVFGNLNPQMLTTRLSYAASPGPYERVGIKKLFMSVRLRE